LDIYRKKGYSEEWINQRLKIIDIRKEFTDELKEKGIDSGKDFAILTNILTQAWSGYSVKEYKNLKGLKKENLRDNMTSIAINIIDWTDKDFFTVRIMLYFNIKWTCNKFLQVELWTNKKFL